MASPPQEVKWNLPWGQDQNPSSHSGVTHGSEHPTAYRPSTDLHRPSGDFAHRRSGDLHRVSTGEDRSFVRRSSQAVGRRVSDVFALLSGRNDNEFSDTDSEEEGTVEGEDEARNRRKSSGGRQPCGHNTEKATEYNQVGRRSMCIEDLTPKPRRKVHRDRAAAGPSEKKKRKSTRSRRTEGEGGEEKPRRSRSERIPEDGEEKLPRGYQPKGYRHSHVPSTGFSVASEAIYAVPVDKESIKRIGKMPEGRTFRHPAPFPVSQAIR